MTIKFINQILSKFPGRRRKLFIERPGKQWLLHPAYVKNAQTVTTGYHLGEMILGWLWLQAELDLNEAILDVGCGDGRVASALARNRFSGTYDGFDIHADRIKALQELFRTRRQFRFHHADLNNPYYNPDGGGQPGAYRYPCENSRMDLVFYNSIFTHLDLSTIRHNLNEARRCLKPGGKLWTSFFLIDDRLDPTFPGIKWHFDAPFGQGFTATPDVPEKCVGFEKALIDRVLAEHGFKVWKYIPGYWKSPRTSLDQHNQDVLVSIKGQVVSAPNKPGQAPVRPETAAKLERLNLKSDIRIAIQARSDRENDPNLQKMWGDHWVKQELGTAISRLGFAVVEHDPDVVIYFFGGPSKKPLLPGALNLVWLYSHPDLVTSENLRSFDRIFCASADYIPKLTAMGYTDVELMPACTAKTPVSSPRAYDIVFLGNARLSRSDGRSAVGALGLTRHNFKVWGNRWPDVLPARYIGGEYWPYERIECLYASAGITLNDHNHDMAREGFVSNKLFDILAGGGFAISEANLGIDRIFGDTVPQYENPQHLRELVDFYLKHDEDREALMFAGRKIALTHTYEKRARQFIGFFSHQ